MSLSFILHILISAGIFAILAIGFKFFVKLKGVIDFSYLAIVIFGSYVGALVNIHFGIGMIGSLLIAFLGSIPFTLLILYLSSKLNDVYFAIGTFALYVLSYQLAFNLESITWWALWLSWMSRMMIGWIQATSLQAFAFFTWVIILLLLIGLTFFKRSYLFRILQWRGEWPWIIKSLGVRINRYKLILIAITTLLAVTWWVLYSFYYLYIDPPSFWLSMLILILVISFLSYSVNDRGTVLIAIGVLFAYEYLRFFKVVDPSQVGYMREMLFGLLTIIVALMVFKKAKFGRTH